MKSSTISKIFLFLSLFLVFFQVSSTVYAEEMKITIIDVGQGDSVLLQTSDNNILIDAGPDQNSTVTYLKDNDIRDISRLIITGPDPDKITGVAEVLKRINVHEFMDFGNNTTQDSYNRIKQEVSNRSIPYTAMKTGDIIPVGEKMSVTVLTPAKVTDNENEPMTLLVNMGNISVLLLPKSDNQNFNISGDVKIVRVADHGSRDGTSARFMSTIRPDIAVISAGGGNDGPSDITIMNLEAAGAKVYRTDKMGTITISSDGDKYSIGTSKKQDSNTISLVSVIETRPPE